jgi:hypothetical protein
MSERHVSPMRKLLEALRPVAEAAEAWGVDGKFAGLDDSGPICLSLSLGEARAALRAVREAEQ